MHVGSVESTNRAFKRQSQEQHKFLQPSISKLLKCITTHRCTIKARINKRKQKKKKLCDNQILYQLGAHKQIPLAEQILLSSGYHDPMMNIGLTVQPFQLCYDYTLLCMYQEVLTYHSMCSSKEGFKVIHSCSREIMQLPCQNHGTLTSHTVLSKGN